MTSEPSASSVARANASPSTTGDRVFSVSDVFALENGIHAIDIMVDNCPMSTACPPWFGDDLTRDEKQKVRLVDILKQPIKSCGKRSVPLFVEGYGQEVPTLTEFNVANVAYPMLSFARLISKGCAFSFGKRE